MPKKNLQAADDRPAKRKPSARSSAKAQRSAARFTAVQILYQADLLKEAPAKIQQEFIDYRIGQIVEDIEIIPADPIILTAIIDGVAKHREAIAQILQRALRGTKPDHLELLLKAILYAGVCELMVHPEIDTGIIISDYLSVTEAFYAGNETKLINAALDAAARLVRRNEIVAPVERLP